MRNLIWLSVATFVVTCIVVFYFVPMYFQAMLVWHFISNN